MSGGPFVAFETSQERNVDSWYGRTYNKAVEYEWDEAKRRSNQAKHEIDFASIHDFEWDSAQIAPSVGHGELRWTANGYIGSRLHMAVYTKRGNSIRIISLRKANLREIRKYAQT